MYDVYIAESMIENDYATFDTPEKKEALIEDVFRKHGVTEAQWDTSLSWYSDHVDIYLKMNDSVKSRLKREQLRIGQLISQEYAREQSLNRRNRSRSYIPSTFAFGAMGEGRGFSFQLVQADLNADYPNNFEFQFDVIGVPQNERPKIKSMLILEYKDTTIYRSATIASNTHYSLPISRYIPNDTLRVVNGFIRMMTRVNIPNGVQAYNISMGKNKSKAKMIVPKTKTTIPQKKEIENPLVQ